MIKIDYVNQSWQTTYVLIADTQGEVPRTGTETAALVGLEELPFGSMVYTPYRDFAILNSSDVWIWKGTEEPVQVTP